MSRINITAASGLCHTLHGFFQWIFYRPDFIPSMDGPINRPTASRIGVYLNLAGSHEVLITWSLNL